MSFCRPFCLEFAYISVQMSELDETIRQQNEERQAELEAELLQSLKQRR